MRLTGVRYEGVTLNGKALTEVTLNEGVLGGIAGRTKVDGKNAAGLEMTGQDSEGGEIKLRVQSAGPDPRNHEVMLYQVEYLKASTSQWLPPCMPDPDGDTHAILIAGLWDDAGKWSASRDLFTLACTGSAIGKCARWGYAPWKTVQGRLLRDLHEACTRMVRADYMGDGKTFTRDGTKIAFHDIFGIRSEPIPSGMQFEAGWSPTGAVVVSRTRFLEKRPTDIVCPAKGSCRLNRSDLTREVLLLNYSYPLGGNRGESRQLHHRHERG